MIKVRCVICKKDLEEPGGLIFGPPAEMNTTEGIVHKFHICVRCWETIAKLLGFGI